MITRLKNFVLLLIQTLEDKPIGFFLWLGIFISIVLVRDFIEGFSGGVPIVGPMDFFVHYPLAFINPFLALVIVLSLTSGEKIIKVSRLMLYVSVFVLLLPPLVDMIHGVLSPGSEKAHIGYLYIEKFDYTDHLINFFNPLKSFKGTTTGIRVEAFVACCLGAIYACLKSRRLWRTLLAFVFLYIVSFGFFTFPYDFYHLTGGPATSISKVKAFFSEYGTIAGNYFNKESHHFANLHLLLFFILAPLWLLVHAPGKFLKFLWTLSWQRTLNSLILISGGVLLGVLSFYGNLSQIRSFTPLDWLTVVSIFISGFVIILSRDIYFRLYYQKSESESVFSRGIIQGILIYSLVLTFFITTVINYGTFTISAVILALMILDLSIPDLLHEWLLKVSGKNENRFITKLSVIAPAILCSFLKTLIFLLFFILGFSLFARGSAFYLFYVRFIFFAIVSGTLILFIDNYINKLWFDKLKKHAIKAGYILFVPAFFYGIRTHPELFVPKPEGNPLQNIHSNLAHQFMWEGMVEHSLLEYKYAILQEHATFENFSSPVFLMISNGNYDDAIEMAIQAVSRFPDSAEALKLLGDCYLTAGHYDKAIPAYLNSLALKQSMEVLHNLAVSYKSSGDFKNAYTSYLKLTENYHQETKFRNELFDLKLDIYNKSSVDSIAFYSQSLNPDEKFKLAACLIKTGKFRNAEKTYREILKKNPEEHLANFLRAAVYTLMEEPDLAIEALQNFIQNEKDYPKAYFELSKLFEWTDQHPIAIQTLEDYLRMNPENPEALSELTLKYLEDGDKKNFCKYLKKMLRMKITDKASMDQFGIEIAKYLKVVSENKGDETFEGCTESIIHCSPPDSNLLNGLGRELINLGLKIQGEKCLEFCLELFPGFIELNFNFGSYLLNEKNPFKALKYLEAASRGYSPNSRIFYMLGVCYASLNRTQDARQALDKTLKIEPGFEKARELHKMLDNGRSVAQ